MEDDINYGTIIKKVVLFIIKSIAFYLIINKCLYDNTILATDRSVILKGLTIIGVLVIYYGNRILSKLDNLKSGKN